MVWESDLWHNGREFDSWPPHYRVTTLGKLFILMSLCHQPAKILVTWRRAHFMLSMHRPALTKRLYYLTLQCYNNRLRRVKIFIIQNKSKASMIVGVLPLQFRNKCSYLENYNKHAICAVECRRTSAEAAQESTTTTAATIEASTHAANEAPCDSNYASTATVDATSNNAAACQETADAW